MDVTGVFEVKPGPGVRVLDNGTVVIHQTERPEPQEPWWENDPSWVRLGALREG